MRPKVDWNDAHRAGESALEAADAEWSETRANGPLVMACARDIKPRKVEWLWEQRLPIGKVVLIAGEGGLGKSMTLAWIAARVSCGGEWPCGEGRSPLGSVIILSAEDDAADTILPRLMAADADCSRVYILSAVRRENDKGHRTFSLQLDLPELEKKIATIGDVRLVIIDPITSYLGAVDSHRNAELRSVLEPLGETASRLKVTVIANTHLNKAVGGSANSRVIGSVAFVNHARAAFIVTADPEDRDRRLFIPSKTNLGRSCQGLAYRIADTTVMGGDGDVIWAPYVKWEENTVTISADEAVAAMVGDAESRGAKDEAKDFLLDVLSDGPVASKEVKRQAEEAGIAIRTLKRAKHSLGVEARREGGVADAGQWLWFLSKRVGDSLRGPTQSLAPLVPSGVIRHFEPDETSKKPKGANSDGGPLSEQGDAFPDVPSFLDRK